MIDHARIANTLGKMEYHLSTHNSICVGVSGGSDSNIIVHMIATYFRDYLPKVHFVFENTGLEYRATLNHLDFLEDYYKIHIDRIRGESVVTVCKREGFPLLSKQYSAIINGVARGVPSYTRLFNGEWTHDGKPSRFNLSEKQRNMGQYCIDNNIKISAKCCDISKKKPFHKYLRDNKCDLTISGERRAENGIRARIHHDCFEHGGKRNIDKYMPLFFWDNETKQYYKKHEGIRYSDCYEVYGLTRTGCVGCPFNSKAGQELRIMQQYEPRLYIACMHVFGESYHLMDKFNVHRHKILEEK